VRRGRYRRAKGRTPRITSRVNGLPNTFYTKLKYYENNYRVTIAENAVGNTFNLSLNDPHDPYAALGGKSAAYYQFWHGAYVYSRVMAAKVMITWGKVNDVNQGIVCTLNPNPGNTVLGDLDDCAAQPDGIASRRFPNRVGGSGTLKKYYSIPYIFRHTRQQYIAQLPGVVLDGTLNTGPTTKATLTVGLWKNDETYAPAMNVQMNVKIIFYVKFYVRRGVHEVGFDAGDTTADAGEIDKADIVLPPYFWQDGEG